jgi:hypothetical protein
VICTGVSFFCSLFHSLSFCTGVTTILTLFWLLSHLGQLQSFVWITQHVFFLIDGFSVCLADRRQKYSALLVGNKTNRC